VVEAPPGLTVPFRVVLVPVRRVWVLVLTVGAVGLVVNEVTEPKAVPYEFCATAQ
jgi:hypothetical protein